QEAAALRLSALSSPSVVTPLVDWLDRDLDHMPTNWTEVLDGLVERHASEPEVRTLLEDFVQNGSEAALREAGIIYLVRLGKPDASVADLVFKGFRYDWQFIDEGMAIGAIPVFTGKHFLAAAKAALEQSDACPGAAVLLRAFTADSTAQAIADSLTA